MLTDRREALSRRRVQTVGRLQALLAELLPGQAKKDITTGQAKAMLATVRPRDLAGKTRRRIAADELVELVAVEMKMKKADAELKAMVLARHSRLMDLCGVGPVVAARVLADVGDVARFADRNRFASWTGTAPLDASSGEQNRHRLSRAGNRRMSHMIHIAAISQLRVDSDGRLLPTQARRGQEASRSDQVSQAPHLRCDLPPARRRRPRLSRGDRRGRRCGGQCGPGRALRGDSRIQRGRPAPAHRHFGSATSRTREDDATTRPAAPGHLTTKDPSTHPLTSEG